MAKDNDDTFDRIVNLPFMKGGGKRNIDDALDLLPMEQEKQIVPVRLDGNDYETAREQIHGTMGTLKTAIGEMASLAFNAQHSRAYEVLGQLVEKMVNASEKLVDIQNKAEKPAGPNTINNTLMNTLMISSSEMLDILKKKKEENG